MKILTFDCYGTLLDTESLYGLIESIAQENNLPPEKARKIFESYEDRLMYGENFMPYDKLLREILIYCDMEMNTDVFSKHLENIFNVHKSFEPFPDVIGTLEYLKKQGYELVLMSNTTNAFMSYHIKKLNNIFADFLTSECAKCYKPNLSFFYQAEKRFSLSYKMHTHIAKGYWWDIVPAAKMGWKKIWVNRSGLARGRTQEQPYITVSMLNELENIL